MAKKNSTIFVCNSCGYESSKWLGKCPACGEWNSFFEEKVVTTQNSSGKPGETISKSKLLIVIIFYLYFV